MSVKVLMSYADGRRVLRPEQTDDLTMATREAPRLADELGRDHQQIGPLPTSIALEKDGSDLLLIKVVSGGLCN